MEYINSGADIVNDQAPLIIQQVLSYYEITKILTIIIAFLILVIASLVLNKGIRKVYNSCDDDGIYSIISVISAALIFISTVVCLVAGIDLVKIWKIPSVFLLELVGRLS